MTKAKLAVAGLVGAFTLTSGLAAANALPAPVQEVASDALGVVGVHVPKPKHDKPKHEPAVVATTDDSLTSTTLPTHPDNKGGEISDLARTTEPGPGHGATVSDAASDGKSRAGEPHPNVSKPEPPRGGPPSTTPADNRPTPGNNGGGTTPEGSNQAEEPSNGAGASGQDNAGGRKP
jgi:hypothetical protein